MLVIIKVFLFVKQCNNWMAAHYFTVNERQEGNGGAKDQNLYLMVITMKAIWLHSHVSCTGGEIRAMGNELMTEWFIAT